MVYFSMCVLNVYLPLSGTVPINGYNFSWPKGTSLFSKKKKERLIWDLRNLDKFTDKHFRVLRTTFVVSLGKCVGSLFSFLNSYYGFALFLSSSQIHFI